MSKRQSRPFTVEIRSSRKNSRNGHSVFPLIPPRGSLPAERWSEDRQGHGTVRDWDGLRMAMREAFDQCVPERTEISEEQNGKPANRVLPSLYSWTPTPTDPIERAPLRKPGRPRKPPRNPEMEATMELEERSEQVSSVVSAPLFDQAGMFFEQVAAADPSLLEPDVSQEPSPIAQRRSGRVLEQSWAYRIACRKAERRGQPTPSELRRRRLSARDRARVAACA